MSNEILEINFNLKCQNNNLNYILNFEQKYNLFLSEEYKYLIDKLCFSSNFKFNFKLNIKTNYKNEHVFVLSRFYTYNEMIEDRKLVIPFEVSKMYGIGTPEDLNDYLRNIC